MAACRVMAARQDVQANADALTVDVHFYRRSSQQVLQRLTALCDRTELLQKRKARPNLVVCPSASPHPLTLRCCSCPLASPPPPPPSRAGAGNAWLSVIPQAQGGGYRREEAPLAGMH